MCDKVLLINRKKINYLLEKKNFKVKDMNKHFLEQETQMANKLVKRCSTFLVPCMLVNKIKMCASYEELPIYIYTGRMPPANHTLTRDISRDVILG